MACWSAENATKAYLKTMRMGEKAKEPNGVEFISALAAGNNAQIMVMACAGSADSTTLALAAAAQQTGGRVICILSSIQDGYLSGTTQGINADNVEFVTGDVKYLLINDYKEADFVAIDCNLENYEGIIRLTQESARCNNTIVLGYNAFCKESWRNSPSCSELLPIGEGLLLIRIAAKKHANGSGSKKRGNWIVKVDKCTGEEHVFRVRSSAGRVVGA
ncbi:uncharacterized protein LOC111393837 [Olea europaea var. sylvestris]|uniref:Uncharacterized protein n=1 Tax=Olea europaea subsp. europaea TaxID=158383 RepID=A0A8S0TK81_OLEEU|nr:uncharacterized protein LOC111393837 [Olea europaea var. sylvestris]CAA3005756.1 Hypothetical predicted protein [Olea europaea subsp. europaea]